MDFQVYEISQTLAGIELESELAQLGQANSTRSKVCRSNLKLKPIFRTHFEMGWPIRNYTTPNMGSLLGSQCIEIEGAVDDGCGQ